MNKNLSNILLLMSRYIKEYQNFLKQDQAKKIINKYKDVMKYLTEYTGKQVVKTSDVYYLYNLFNEQVNVFIH